MTFSMLGELKRLAEEGTTVGIGRERFVPADAAEIVRIVAAGPKLTWINDSLDQHGGLLAVRTKDITSIYWGSRGTARKGIRFRELDLATPPHRALLAAKTIDAALDVARRFGLKIRIFTEDLGKDTSISGFYTTGVIVAANRTHAKLELPWKKNRVAYDVFERKHVTCLAILAEE